MKKTAPHYTTVYLRNKIWSNESQGTEVWEATFDYSSILLQKYTPCPFKAKLIRKLQELDVEKKDENKKENEKRYGMFKKEITLHKDILNSAAREYVPQIFCDGIAVLPKTPKDPNLPCTYFMIVENIEINLLYLAVLNLREELTKYILYKSLLAIQAIHKEGIVHRDTKLENIMLKRHENYYSVKVIDFGNAKKLFNNHHNGLLQTFVMKKHVSGTPDYVPPEISKPTSDMMVVDYNGFQFDAYSMGISAIRLFCKGFDGAANNPIFKNERFKDLINGLICKDPIDRYTISEAINHEYFTKERIIPDEEAFLQINQLYYKNGNLNKHSDNVKDWILNNQQRFAENTGSWITLEQYRTSEELFTTSQFHI